MPGLRSPLLPLGLAGFEPAPHVAKPGLRSPLFILGFSGYTAPPVVRRAGYRSVLGLWGGGFGGYQSTATEAGPAAVWRPIFQSGTRRR